MLLREACFGVILLTCSHMHSNVECLCMKATGTLDYPLFFCVMTEIECLVWKAVIFVPELLKGVTWVMGTWAIQGVECWGMQEACKLAQAERDSIPSPCASSSHLPHFPTLHTKMTAIPTWQCTHGKTEDFKQQTWITMQIIHTKKLNTCCDQLHVKYP